MSITFKIIILVMLGWAGLVSLVTGQIYLRTSASKKGPRPRLFGLCLILAGVALALQWGGVVSAAYEIISISVIVSLLGLALILAWLS